MTFPLAGNERVKTALCTAIRENRIPHAILIEGDAGTGKHTLAKFLAAAAVCTGEERPCGICRGCHLAQAGTHPDIRVTAPEQNRKTLTVAQIRDLRQEAYVKPHSADRRVFVIDRADAMNEQAQNALLKVLEEPPGAVIFLLLAESKAALLPTVRSRTVTVTLAPPNRETVLAYLKHHFSLPEEQLQTAWEESGGNIGSAIQLLKGEDRAGIRETAARFLSHMLMGEEWKMLTIAAPLLSNRLQTDHLIRECKLAISAEMRKSLASPETLKKLTRLYELLCDCEQSLLTNINLNLLFCSLACRAATISKE